LEAIDGLVALLASPDGRTIARAIAPQGDGTPYRHLGLIDVETGELTPVLEQDCLAYFWIPTGQGLLACRVDTQRNLLVWQRIDRRGQVDTVFEMTPTRDLGFYLRFFEQYAQSHRIVSPHGEHLLVAGALPNEKSNENPTLWQVRLRDGRAEPVAHGVFGVYAPESEEPCLSDEH